MKEPSFILSATAPDTIVAAVAQNIAWKKNLPNLSDTSLCHFSRKDQHYQQVPNHGLPVANHPLKSPGYIALNPHNM